MELDLTSNPAQTRVVVAMSGGVDSSVVAALLKRAGYDVIGITLQLYDHGEAVHRRGACCAGQDIHDARNVAEKIGIPHYVLDYETRFRAAVMDSFAESYLAGETPIPCVECNQKVKFADLLQMAQKLGAQAMATGHYVSSQPLPNGNRGLFRAVDPDKDQSYFLYATTQEQLNYLRFPLGDMTKQETRALAQEFGLQVANKADSQDICFVPNGGYAEIVKKLRPEAVEPGEIVHMDGRILGTHEGIIHYTIGQRRGIGLSFGEPLYVVRLDAKSRRVIVGPREALATRSVHLRDINWIGNTRKEDIPAAGIEVYVKVRSARAACPALLMPADDGELYIELLAPETGVAPGQACVFYESADPRARVLGGGIIKRSTRAENSVAFDTIAGQQALRA